MSLTCRVVSNYGQVFMCIDGKWMRAHWPPSYEHVLSLSPLLHAACKRAVHHRNIFHHSPCVLTVSYAYVYVQAQAWAMCHTRRRRRKRLSLLLLLHWLPWMLAGELKGQQQYLLLLEDWIPTSRRRGRSRNNGVCRAGSSSGGAEGATTIPAAA